MTDLLDQLMARPGRYLGTQTSHEGGSEHQGVSRMDVSVLPGGVGVAIDYEVLVPQAGAVHEEHAVIARAGAGLVLVTAHNHSPVLSVVAEDPSEPGWFPGAEGSAPFPFAIRVEVPEPGHLIYSWSYAAPGEELAVRDVGDLRHRG
jgi:hypothetical protein